MSRDRIWPTVIAFLAAGVTVLVDQAAKAAARDTISQDERIPLLGDALGLQLAFNPGAILSLGSDATWLLTAVGAIAVVLLTFAATRVRTMGWALGVGLILGGALGNLLDRLFSPPAFGRGFVTDFLAYGDLFIGNIADIALGMGVVVLGLSAWRNRQARPPDPPLPDTSRSHTGGTETEEGAS